MEFGVQFFPAVGPEQKAADQYWREALHLTRLAEQLGFTNVRTVEHYFLSYGGYSPDPLIFLSAAAAITRSIRLVTGAVLPVFNNPLKLAGQIGMVDAISGGRLEVGFARAFLPHEFARFGIAMDESRARFEEGLEQIRRLLEEERVTAKGRFHSFENATSLPRPTQKPRPRSGQIGMVDAISGGRLEVGFARAFLPHEFARFGIAMDESRARFEEGLEQIRRLLEEERVTAKGRFHSFENATSLPRPTQKPRPPFWIAARSRK